MQRTIEEKNTQYSDRYYAGKWDGIWDKPKYQKIRDHILKSFEGLTFDEGPHKYYYKGKEFTPTSNVCHCFRIPFHEEEMAQHCEDKYFNDPVSKYFQMTTAQILESWHENSLRATTHGTKIHLFGENCSYFSMRQMDRLTDDFKARIEIDEDGDVYVMPKEPKEEAVIKFWKDVPVCIVPLLFEVQMFDTEWEVSGTADLLFVYDPHLDKDDNEQELVTRLYLGDYKTNGDLYKSFGNMLPPFEELPDNDLGGYKVQAGIYTHFLMNLGYKFVARTLIWLKDNGTYEKVKMESFTEILREYFKKHPIKQLLEERK